ncbi:MAG: HDOD domain-containing protein [Ruminiclostridium sp.]|nr:HDOD domain-containing protein [Ruminiclostridium sp.]
MSFLISKQAVFNQSGGTDMYEMLYSFASKKNPLGDESLVSDDEIAEAKEYITQNMNEIFDKKTAYIRLSQLMLDNNFYELFLKERLVLEIPTELLADPVTLQQCMRLKRLGYTIVLSGFLYEEDNEELFNFADILRFDINSDADEIAYTVKKCHERGKRAMADNVEEQEHFEFARSLDIDYVRGGFFSKPVLETKRSGGPMIKTFLQILALLYSPEPNIEYISAVISTDPVLTIKLLKVINQLCADKGNTVSTVRQALVMLGIDRLKEWIYLVGLQRLNRNSPAEILRLALFRARFCERISRNSGGSVGSRSNEVYLMGLISIVTGSSDEEALTKALADLPVSQEIKDGITGDGIFGDIFRLSRSYEIGEWDKVVVYATSCHVDFPILANEYIEAQKFVKKYGNFA